jgi:hypothetical protein
VLPPIKLKLAGDISRLNQRMAKYARLLQIEPREVVQMQAGILSRELAEGAAPRSKQALEQSIEKDIGRVYAPAPKRMLPVAHRQGRGFVWLVASPQVLVGVKPNDYHLEDTVGDMTRLFHKTKPRENRYEQLGARRESMGNAVLRVARGRDVQKVVRLNRIVVRRPVYSQFATAMKKRAGILGGSWVISWAVLQPKGRKPPAYKFRHVEDGSARGTYINSLGIPGHATFSLVNRATGCEHPKQLEMVRGKIRYRLEAMTADLKNLLRGAYKRAGFKKA